MMEIEKNKLRINGISPELFLDKVEDEFLCTFCHSVLWMAMQASCGCRFCYSCIRTENPECTSCNIKIDRNEITDDFYARRRLRKKRMSCLNKRHGCGVNFEFKDLDNHLKECSYVKVNCIHFKSGCRTKILRIHLKLHLEKECEFRLISCTYCEEKISFKDLKSHNCVNKPNICPNECDSKAMLPEELNKHLNSDCPLVLLDCQFEKMGCNEKILRKDLEVHQQEYTSEHLVKVSKKLEEQNLISVKLGRENAELISRCELLTNKSHEQSTEMYSLRKKIQTMESEMENIKEMMNSKFNEIRKECKKSSQQCEEQVAILHVEQNEQSKELQMVKTRNARDQGNVLPAARLGNGGLETHMTIMKVELAELQSRVGSLEETSYDGTLFWRIPNIDKAVREAVGGKTSSLYSQPFYTSRFGYKMCLRLYLNGDGMGRNTHVSLFFVIMRGMYDALLPWPFNQKVTFILLDQETGQRSMSDSFNPDGNSSSFQMPKRNREMNIASGCPLFVSKCVLRDPTYVKDDTMYIKAIVEPLAMW